MDKTPIGNFFPGITIAATDTIIAPAANRRRSVTFFNPAAVTITVSFGFASTVNLAINIPGNQLPVSFVRDAHLLNGIEIGSLIDQEIHAISNGASHVSMIITYEP